MATSTTDYDLTVSLVLLSAIVHHAMNTNARFWLLSYVVTGTVIWPVMGRLGIVDYNYLNVRFGELLGTSPFAPTLKPMSYCFALAWMVVFMPAAAYAVATW